MKGLINTNLNVRSGTPEVQPDNNLGDKYYVPGEEVTISEVIIGQGYRGNRIWYKLDNGSFVWSGGVNLSQGDPFLLLSDKDKCNWWLREFQVDRLWQLSKGKGVSISILDSGINPELPDFKAKENIRFFNAITKSSDKADCLDLEGHGTDCAGIACAAGHAISGVAPEARLNVIKITDKNGGRSTQAILDGLEQAIQFRSDIISLSFYIAEDPLFDSIHKKIQEAYDHNIIVLASVGNSGGLNFPVDNYPAAFPECLSIGGLNRERKRSTSSTKSNFLNLMGPAEDLMSLSSGKLIKGSSYSAPFVAGGLALIKAILKDKGQKRSNTELYDTLKETARSDFQGYNTTDYGWGVLNLEGTLNLITK